MRLPGYSEDDNAFYERAEKNYTPEKTDKPGEWPLHPQNGVPLNYVGDVKVRTLDGRFLRVEKPYAASELHNIIKQGQDRPRQLETQEESRKANAARREYREQSQWFEQWAVRENGARRQSAFANVSKEFVPV